MRTRIQITLPQELLDIYHSIADRQEKSVEQMIEIQLYRYQDHESVKPIILSDISRRHLESLLGKNISTGDELVSILQRALTMRMDDIDVPLTLYLLDRLKSRCIGMEWEKFLPFTIKRLVEEFVGVR